MRSRRSAPGIDQVAIWLARLGHDLRNQLAPMRTASQFLLSRNVDPERQREMLEMLDRQVGRLTDMLDDLSELGQCIAPPAERKMQDLDLGILVDSAVGQCARHLAAAGLAFEQHMPDRRLPVRGERQCLIQAIVRLLDNARRFSAQGGSVNLAIEVEHEFGVVRVRDPGSGIDPERLETIFALPECSRRSERLGISLLLARACAHAHGGSLEARSEGAGRGSEFVLRLPLAKD
jgi:signal transduction histidine kinase